MQYDVNTPTEYFEQLDEDWRKEKLLQVRDIILEHTTDLSEFIQFKMLAYGLNDNAVFHLNAQKNYVGLYVGNIDKIDPDRQLLDSIDCGKGCIRIKKTNELSGVDKFINRAVARWQEGGDIGC